MTNELRPNVLAAFDLLHEQMEADRDLIHLAGSQAFKSGNYDVVRECLHRSWVYSDFLKRASDLEQDFARQTGKQMPDVQARRETQDRDRRPPLPPSEVETKGRETPRSRLRVTFTDGKVIEEPVAADTFVRVLQRIGLPRVASLGLLDRRVPLVGHTKHITYTQRRCDDYCPCDGTKTLAFRRILQVLHCSAMMSGHGTLPHRAA